ncbi:MAG: YceI family protein [Opitutaceae bacterium]|nr:YceI family protein [Opitutaceae bacterium]
MNLLRLTFVLLFLPLAPAAAAADAPAATPIGLRIDRTRSFIDVDVNVTVGSFVAHLDKYDARFVLDDTGKIKTGRFQFKFADLKTGSEQRDAAMLKWLGGIGSEGVFQLGVLAIAPDGQGVANGNLTFHDATQRIEFTVLVTQADGAYTVTGETSIDYTDWGLKVIRRMGLVKVDPRLHIRFKLVGEPDQPSARH